MSKKPNLTLVKPTNGQRPPRRLGKAGLALWSAVTSAYDISDVGGIEILMEACATRDRVEQLAAQIENDGPLVKVRGVTREHPLLKAELAGRAFIVRSLMRLGLNVETIKPSVGRPPGWSPPLKFRGIEDEEA